MQPSPLTHYTVKKTVQQLVEQDNHYLVTVKGNQPTLHQAFKQVQQEQIPISEHIESDNSHGRSVKRWVSIYSPSDIVIKQWPNASSMIVRQSSGQRDGKPFCCVSYYLSDRVLDAASAGSIIRQHRDIENGLHWVRDVVLGEDASLITKRIPAINWSVMRSFVVNIFRAAGKVSLTQAIRMYSHDIPTLISLLITN